MLLLRSGHGGVGTVLLGSWGSSRDGRAGGSTRGGTASGSVARHDDDGVVWCVVVPVMTRCREMDGLFLGICC